MKINLNWLELKVSVEKQNGEHLIKVTTSGNGNEDLTMFHTPNEIYNIIDKLELVARRCERKRNKHR